MLLFFGRIKESGSESAVRKLKWTGTMATPLLIAHLPGQELGPSLSDDAQPRPSTSKPPCSSRSAGVHRFMGIAFLNRSRQVRAAFSQDRGNVGRSGPLEYPGKSTSDGIEHKRLQSAPGTHSCLLGVVLESIADTGVPRSQAPFTRGILHVALRGDLSVRQAH